jgi:predicted MPP superfamily phosphohydrolase
LVFFWAFLIEPNRLVVREQTIQLDDWPGELNGLRIAVLSDIHAGGWFIDDKKLRTIVQRTNQLQPDLIVILGDYISGDGRTSERIEPEVFGAILKDLHAPFGVYSVRGTSLWLVGLADLWRIREQSSSVRDDGHRYKHSSFSFRRNPRNRLTNRHLAADLRG